MKNSEIELKQQQARPKEEFDARRERENFFLQSSKFDDTKKFLNTVGNYYVNYLFSLLGYQYKGKVENVNILHLCAKAWLLGAFSELKKENNEKVFSNGTTYSQLLSHIKQTIVEENNFIENLNLLTGIYGLNEFAFEDKNIFKMFLVNIQATKNTLFIEDDEEITQQKFEEILSRIFRMAFNYTLNELNSEEKDKKSLEMLNTYLDLLSLKDQPLNSENFIKAFYLKKEIKLSSPLDEERERRLNLNLEYYFNFLNTTFGDLIGEIELFNKNSYSVIFKLKTLLSFKNIQRLYIKYVDLLTNSFELVLRNLRLESVLNFTRNMYEVVKPLAEKSAANLKKSYSQVRMWISSAAEKPLLYYDMNSKNILQYTSQFYQATLRYSEIPRKLVVDKVYTPLRNLTINLKDSYLNLAVNTFELGKNKTLQLKNSIQDKVTNLKNNIVGEEPLVKIEDDSEDKCYLNISISKRLFIVNPAKAKELIAYIIDLVRCLSVVNISTTAYNYTKNKVEQTRNYLHTSYKKFLELANEDENEEDLLIESLARQNKIKSKEKIQ